MSMRFKVISVGKIKEKSIIELINEYSKRINVEFTELKDSNKETEGKKIIEILDKMNSKYVFVLSEEGKEFTSVEFSQKIKKIEQPIIFVIGGPTGLSDEVKKRTDFLLSLSKMTFTHEMAKLFLVEQIYRAMSIIENKNYHKQ